MSAGALIEAISTTGSSTVAGLPNASGQVAFYVPGTTTPTTVYSDAAATVAVNQPVTLDNAGRLPYADFPNGIYCTGPIRLFITDSGGSTVSDTTYQIVAGNVAVSNSGFTGTTVDAVLTAAFASFGGQDFKYNEHSGATSRLVQDKFREIAISVKDYGAVGDGLTDDTTAIQSTINRVVAIGGGVLYFPPTSAHYKITALLTVAASTGITVKGAGIGSTTITQATSSTDVISFSASTGLVMDGLSVSGGGVVMTSPTTCRISGCSLNSPGAYGLSVTNGNGVTVADCSIVGTTESIFSSGTANLQVRGGTLNSSPTGIVIAGTSTEVYCSSVIFGGGTGIKWNSGASGSNSIIPSFVFVDCPTLGGRTAFDFSALSGDPGIYQRNCAVNKTSVSAAVGNTVTPLMYAQTTEITASSGGAGTMTVASPSGFQLQPGNMIMINFINASGGAVTWTLNSVFVTNTTIPTTDGTKNTVLFYYDGTHLREISRGQTT